MSVSRILKSVAFCLLQAVCLCVSGLQYAGAQTDPQQEHLSHHPELQQEQNGAPAQEGGMMGGGMMGGGMMQQMGDMMKQMNLPKPKELYPSLMTVPELPRSERVELEERAHQRMKDATALLSEGLESLSREAAGDDYAAMQVSTTKLKEALVRFESALATHRALAEGQAPKNVALQWFKREMDISAQNDQGHSFSHYSWLHLSTMVFLGGFALLMIVMYFFKMRRASTLLQELVQGASPVEQAVARSSSTPKAAVGEKAGPSRAAAKKWSGKLKVSRIFNETPDVKTFRLMNPVGGMLPFNFLPGQFLTVSVTNNGEQVKRGYTIASSPTQSDYLELTIKHKEGGVVSSVLHNDTKEGDLLECSGPSGSFTFTGQECKCILLVGAGVGITPLMSVLRYLTDRSWPGDIYLVYGCKTPDDIIYEEELTYLQHRHPNLKVIITISRSDGTEWAGHTGRINRELLENTVPDLVSRYVHICGPVPMIDDVKNILSQIGIPSERVRAEAFGPALGKPEPSKSLKEDSSSDVAVSTVRFSLSDVSAPLPADRTILEVADDAGVEIDNSCRTGICGLCKVKLTKGSVAMEVEDSLTTEDKAQGLILACQARSEADVEVDA